MQFDAIGRHTRLAVEEIEHPDSSDRDGYVGGLKAGGDMEFRIELSSRVGDAVEERAAAPDAMGCGYLADHCVPTAVADDEMIVFVAFELVLCEGCVNDPDCGFCRLHSIVRRNRAGRGEASHICDGGLCR